MIRGISDLDYNDSKKVLAAILEHVKTEEEELHRETDEKLMQILMHEYEKRLIEDRKYLAEKDEEIEACNSRMREIEEELYRLADRRNYFEVQLEMLGVK